MVDIAPPLLPRKGIADDPKRIGLWKIGRTIGTGSSGRVRIARHSKTGEYAAIKIISKTTLNSRASLNRLADEMEHNQLAIEREIVVMKLINHPNIMRLYDVWETSTELYLVLEYIQGGELFEYLCSKGRLSESEALGYFQQIIGAMDYCHRFNIAHRDLKPENILLDQDLNIKIVDFGMAAWQVHSQDGMLRTSCGSPHYAAPEIVLGKAYNGSAADIWSCGIILYALLVGKLPFDHEDCPTLLEKVLKGNFIMPSDIDPLAQNLIRQMLTIDVERRITMANIMLHPFFTSRAPKLVDCSLPSLDHIARPIGNLTSIDADIFANLRTLWHSTPDAEIIESLMNVEQNWQKGIYHLLVEYRERHLESYQEEEEEIARAKLLRKKSKKGKVAVSGIPRTPLTDKNEGTSSSSLPPRDGPPTPRRAASHVRDLVLSSNGSICDHLQNDLQAPTIHLQSASPSPAASPLSPIWSTLNLPPLTVPELQDDRIQAFFHQIVHHLNALQAKTEASDHGSSWGGSPNLVIHPSGLDFLNSRGTNTTAPPPTPIGMHHDWLEETPGRRNQGSTTELSNHTPPDRPPLSLGIATNGTRPLSVRQKPQVHRATVDTGSSDKENARENGYPIVSGTGGVMKKPSLKSGNGKKAGLGDKRVHIIEPSRKERSKLRKKKSTGPASPAFSDTGSSFTVASPSSASPFSSSPKRSWLGNVFKFRPTNLSLISLHDVQTSRNECRRLLMRMDVRVVLEGAEGLGVLRCRLDDVKDPSGIMSVLKAVRFRVELHRPPREENDRNTVSLVLIHERGSMESFREVYKRLEMDWSLDVVGSAPPKEVTPAMGANGRVSV